MSPRQELRAATADEHERVDRLFSMFDLGTDEGYRAFLSAQAWAYLPVEKALDTAGAARLIDDWRERRRAHLLLADLEELGAGRMESSAQSHRGVPVFSAREGCERDAAILGALYVLEGSRLGGAVLKRRLPPGMPVRFLGTPQSPGAWRKLLEILDECLYEPERLAVAVGTARDVFMRFESGGRRVLENAAA
ncbi:MAG TPA: biliverdin-producing heme oxygenase [Allosphingosinicella sp.]